MAPLPPDSAEPPTSSPLGRTRLIWFGGGCLVPEVTPVYSIPVSIPVAQEQASPSHKRESQGQRKEVTCPRSHTQPATDKRPVLTLAFWPHGWTQETWDGGRVAGDRVTREPVGRFFPSQ